MKRLFEIPAFIVATSIGLVSTIGQTEAQICLLQQQQCMQGCRGSLASQCILQCTTEAFQCAQNSSSGDDSPSQSHPTYQSRSNDDDDDGPPVRRAATATPSYQQRQASPAQPQTNSTAAGSGQCQDATSYVSVETRYRTGPGSFCTDREVQAFITNRSNQRVVCDIAFERTDGGLDSKSMTGVAAGRTIGGESGGLWTCGGSDKLTGRVRYYCAVQPDGRNDFMCKSGF